MRIFKSITILVAVFAMAGGAAAQENELGWTMESALEQIDRQAQDMESVLAQVDIEWSGDAQAMGRITSGRIYFNDDGDFRLRDDSDAKLVALVDRNVLSIYDPGAKTVQEIRLSRDESRLEPFLRIGFTVTGDKLEDDYLVTFVGEQEIGDRRTLGLELTPEDADMRAIVSKAQIWFDQASWLPVKQIVTHTSGTKTVTVTYSGMARNLNLNPDLFKADWPRGTDKIK